MGDCSVLCCLFPKQKHSFITYNCSMCINVWHLNECSISMCKDRMSFCQQPFASYQCSFRFLLLCSSLDIYIYVYLWRDQHFMSVSNIIEPLFMNSYVLRKWNHHASIALTAMSWNTIVLWFQWMHTKEFLLQIYSDALNCMSNPCEPMAMRCVLRK